MPIAPTSREQAIGTLRERVFVVHSFFNSVLFSCMGVMPAIREAIIMFSLQNMSFSHLNVY